MKRFLSVAAMVVLAAGVSFGQWTSTPGGLKVNGDLQVNGDLKTKGGAVSIADQDLAAPTAVATASTITERNIGVVQRTQITFDLSDTSVDLNVADGAHGDGQQIFTFPEGRILILGAALDATTVTTTNYNASTADIFTTGIGTATAGDDDALTSTEVDIIASTNNDTAGGGTASFTWEADMTSGADSVFDGTSTPVSLYVNTACAAANNSADNIVSASGTLNVVWVYLGDD